MVRIGDSMESSEDGREDKPDSVWTGQRMGGAD